MDEFQDQNDDAKDEERATELENQTEEPSDPSLERRGSGRRQRQVPRAGAETELSSDDDFDSEENDEELADHVPDFDQIDLPGFKKQQTKGFQSLKEIKEMLDKEERKKLEEKRAEKAKIEELKKLKKKEKAQKKKERQQKKKKVNTDNDSESSSTESLTEDSSYDDDGNLIIPAWKKQGLKFIRKILFMIFVHSLIGDIGIVGGLLHDPFRVFLSQRRYIVWVSFFLCLIFVGLTMIKRLYHNVPFACINYFFLTFSTFVYLATLASKKNAFEGLGVLIVHNVLTVTILALYVHCSLVKGDITLFKSLMFIVFSHVIILSIYSMLLESYTLTMVISSFIFAFVGLGINQNLMVILYGKRRVRPTDFILISQRMYLEVVLILTDPTNFTVELG